jgi:hypothetical protein
MTEEMQLLDEKIKDLLPSNLLSEMDYNEENEKTEESESYDEVDVSFKINLNLGFILYKKSN